MWRWMAGAPDSSEVWISGEGKYRVEGTSELDGLLSHGVFSTSALGQVWPTDFKHLRGFHDKLETYRTVIDLVSEILGDFDRWEETKQQLPAERKDALNRARIKAYGYMALLASQPVMDAFDRLFDHLLRITHGNAPYVWAEIRELSLGLLNEVRKDVGIDSSPIEYRGNL